MHQFDPHALPFPPPLPADADRARIGIERWLEAAKRDADDVAERAQTLADDPATRAVLDGVFGNSPFLTQCAIREPALTTRLLTQGWDDAESDIMAGIDALRRDADLPALGRGLRVAKRRLALVTGVADILGIWDTRRVMQVLSGFADAAISCAVAHLLRETAASGAFELADPDDPEKDSGFLVLGMGKLGARELNYSSDVDLILLFDPERIRAEDMDLAHSRLVRMTRQFVKLMEERTAEGYVFRTDLRLRPDPASTPPVISILAAEVYYESIGQNWERAAMIKARPVAGDLDVGAAFAAMMQPYIWRKNLDFAAIQDIHSIKRQINAHRGGATIAVAGHNVKLGRGGIREIEFFVQTQQLIWGGRQPELRGSGTVETLGVLRDLGHISVEAADDMAAAYDFLRRVEHRLQMVDDEQTHSLPETPEDLRAIAVFLGYADTKAFAADLLGHLGRVEEHYVQLFEDAPSLSRGDLHGNLVFTGNELDPDTQATLAKMGYRNPKAIDATIRGWHHGRYRAMRSSRARELLTELIPGLLAALARPADPDTAFLNFDRFLSHLPAGVQLFSMFRQNPQLLELVAEIMGGAPRLAQHLSRNAAVLDSVLAEDFFGPPPDGATMKRDLAAKLGRASALEEALDIGRRWTHDQQFQAGVHFMRGLLVPREASLVLVDVAETAIREVARAVETEFAKLHGRIADSALVTLALGRLGSREMTPTSDLDLIFVYDCALDGPSSDGERPLPPSQYFGRLSQRIINALTAQTAEGVLYEVDMRLRPSGAKGPIASSLEAFIRYHEDSAWTWEHMALTRARFISGPERLRERVETVIRDALTQPRDPETLLRDVADMRRRHDAEHHTDFVWDAKLRRGGLVDIEFIAQYLQLRHAREHPEILSPTTCVGLECLRDAGLMKPRVADELIAAWDLWHAIQMALRLTIEGRFVPEREGEMVEGLRILLARVGVADDFDELRAKMAETAATVMTHFRAIIDEPASRLTEETT